MFISVVLSLFSECAIKIHHAIFSPTGNHQLLPGIISLRHLSIILLIECCIPYHVQFRYNRYNNWRVDTERSYLFKCGFIRELELQCGNLYELLKLHTKKSTLWLVLLLKTQILNSATSRTHSTHNNALYLEYSTKIHLPWCIWWRCFRARGLVAIVTERRQATISRVRLRWELPDGNVRAWTNI